MPNLIVKVGGTDPTKHIAFRKTLDGKVLIFDHPNLDIVVDPSKRKISLFAKDTLGDHVYDSQDQLFKHLMQQGIINYDSVQAGNVFNAMEAGYLDAADNRDPLKEVLLAIKNHVDNILPYYKAMEKYEESYEESLLDPSEEESTNMNEIPHAPIKGVISSPYVRSVYSFT